MQLGKTDLCLLRLQRGFIPIVLFRAHETIDGYLPVLGRGGDGSYPTLACHYSGVLFRSLFPERVATILTYPVCVENMRNVLTD